MIPDYLRDEIVLRLSSRRLHRSKLKAICRLLEIDFDAALNPGPSAEELWPQLSTEGPLPYTGVISFELETHAGKHARRVPGRVVYGSEGLNPLGQIGLTPSTCEILAWDPDQPAPSWEQIPKGALPDELTWQLSEQVLDAVIEQQRDDAPPPGTGAGA